MEDIFEIAKSLEESCLLTKGTSKIIGSEVKNKKVNSLEHY